MDAPRDANPALRATPTTPGQLALYERRVAHPVATVLCVHGSLDRAASFARVARRLDGYDVVAYDRRGYQGSRELEPVNFAEHVKDAGRLLRAEEAAPGRVVLGHSYGGVVALATAASCPGLVSALILYESPLPWLLTGERDPDALGTDGEKEAETFFRRMVSDGAWTRLSEHERTARRLDGRALIDDLATLRRAAPIPWRDVTSPVTYAYGDGPRLSYFTALAAVLPTLWPTVRLAPLARAGHGAHLTQPDQMARLIREAWTQSQLSRP